MEKHENEKDNTIRNQENEEDQMLIKQLQRSLILSAIFQIPYLLLLFVFYNLALLVTMDILYFPPFLNFNLKNYYIWNGIFIALSVILILQLILGVFLRILVKMDANKMLRPILQFISCVQLLYLPVGTYYGLYEFQLAKKFGTTMQGSETQDNISKKSEDYDNSNSKLVSADFIEETNRKIGKIFIGVGAHWLGLLLLLILLTFYFSTVMLDMTYPYLTMGVLLSARTVLGIMIGISITELLFGQFYYKIPKSKLKVVIFRFFWVWSLILVPVGTSGARVLRKLQSQR